MRTIAVALLIVTVCVASLLGSPAEFLSSTPTTVVLRAQYDVYVSSNNPDSCYGREVVLNVRSYFDGTVHFNHRTYIQFDVSSLPRNIVIVSALLWLYKNPEGANLGVRRVQAFRVTSTWDEYFLNWNNQPSVSSEPTATTPVDGAMMWYSWDLTEDVKAWDCGTVINNGTMLQDETENSKIDYASVFLSREASHPENPYLEIKYVESTEKTATTFTGPQITKETWILVALLTILILAGVGWAIVNRRMKGHGSESSAAPIL